MELRIYRLNSQVFRHTSLLYFQYMAYCMLHPSDVTLGLGSSEMKDTILSWDFQMHLNVWFDITRIPQLHSPAALAPANG